MPSQVRCPNPDCGKSYTIASEIPSGKARCKGCGHVFELAGSRDRSAEAPPDPKATTPRDANLPDRLGRFLIRDRLGSGAFGTVYRAFDPSLDREVALKVPQAGLLDSPRAVERFAREAKAAAQLRHPNIVPVFETGVDRNQNYIVSAYIEGQTLADAIEPGGMDCKSAVKIVLELAEALHYAHSLGIIHRDVKPANVMLDTTGRPMLMDFGLARFASSDEKLTKDGAILGTPAFMAPEQARGDGTEADAASDQYSLGVILYELLTGTTPFSGPAEVVLFNAIHHEPTSPRKHRKNLPRDLETICLKAMNKLSVARYRGCQALADDLRRWLDDMPIYARPMGVAEKTARWARRNPTVGALSGLVTFLILVAVIGGGMLLARLVQQRGKIEAEARINDINSRKLTDQTEQLDRRKKEADQTTRELAEKANQLELKDSKIRDVLQDAQSANALAKAKEEEAEKQTILAAQSRKAAEKERAQAELAGVERERIRYYSDIASSYDEITRLGKTDRARILLDSCPKKLRGWEWYHCQRLCHSELMTLEGHTSPIRRVVYSPDGSMIATASLDGTIGLWNAKDGRLIDVLQGHWSFKGIRRKNVKNTVFVVPDQTKPVNDLAFDPETGHLASAGGDGVVKIWDLNAIPRIVVDELHPLENLQGVKNVSAGMFLGKKVAITSVAFSPIGGYLAAGRQDGHVILWNMRQGFTEKLFGEKINSARSSINNYGIELCRPIVRFNAPVSRVGFRPISAKKMENSVLFASGLNGIINFSIISQFTDFIKGNYVKNQIEGMVTERNGERGDLIETFRYSSRTYSNGEDEIKIEGTRVDDLKHINTNKNSNSIAFDPNGNSFVSAGSDKSVLLIDSRNGNLIQTFHGHLDRVNDVAYNHDGREFASASGDHTVRVWNDSRKEPFVLAGHAGEVYSVAYSPDGKQLASAGADMTVKVWDPSKPQGAQPLVGHLGNVLGLAFDPLRSSLVTVGQDRAAIVWDTTTKQQTGAFPHPDSVHSVAISSDDRWIATACKDGNVRVWPRALFGGKPKYVLRHPGVRSVTFAPGGAILASGGEDGMIKVWSMEIQPDPKQKGDPLLFIITDTYDKKTVWALTFHPDKKRLAAAYDDGNVLIWDLAFPTKPICLGSMKGPTLAGREFVPNLSHAGPIYDLTFSPDGSLLATAGADKTIGIWDVEQNRLFQSLKGHVSDVTGVAFHPDRRTLASASKDQTVKIWDFANARDVLTLRGHEAEVLGVAFSPDGRILASFGADKTTRLWEAELRPIPEGDVSDPSRIQAPSLADARSILKKDSFENAASGWPRGNGRSQDFGYLNGSYHVRLRTGDEAWQSIPINDTVIACRVVGRARLSPSSAWGFGFESGPANDRRGFRVRIDRSAQLFVDLEPPGKTTPGVSNKGPLKHKDIKAGDDPNELLVIHHGGQIEVFVNSIAVCDPIPFESDPSDPRLFLGATGKIGATEGAEFGEIEVQSAEHLPIRVIPKPK